MFLVMMILRLYSIPANKKYFKTYTARKLKIRGLVVFPHTEEWRY